MQLNGYFIAIKRMFLLQLNGCIIAIERIFYCNCNGSNHVDCAVSVVNGNVLVLHSIISRYSRGRASLPVQCTPGEGNGDHG